MLQFWGSTEKVTSCSAPRSCENDACDCKRGSTCRYCTHKTTYSSQGCADKHAGRRTRYEREALKA
eukprot:6184460-Pleurochrysis_carterae.AAC.4